LKDYPVKVINNGIDMSVFKVTRSDFKKRYGVEDKKIILGVAFDWGISKGLDVFIELATRLSDKYQIVLVGTNDKIDKQLPNNIISIHRTQNQQELVQIYSAADVFVNPTREDNYPTVNMEALACGTPVLTFKTGGSPEILDETCGMVVDCDDVDAMENEIIRICTGTIYSERDCINTACGFDQNERFEEYLKLYERVISTGN
jgi:glycosyltransferase involved in cell wall biosynthesis